MCEPAPGPSCPACGRRSGRSWAELWPAPGRRPRLRLLRPPHLLRNLTSPLRRLPDFVVIGARKSGTTTLHDRLCRHPRVVPALRKEIFFFVERNYAADRLWYRRNFPTVFEARGKVAGDATPAYMFHPSAPARARAVVPRARIIAVLRNPVDRAYSEYNMRLAGHREGMTFEDALDCEARRVGGHLDMEARDPGHVPYGALWHSYAGGGLYADALARWRGAFDPGRVLAVSAEDLRADGRGTMDSIFEFLGLEPRDVGGGDSNVRRYPPMKPATRRRLVEFYRPHNARLYRMLGREFDWDR